MWGILVVRLHTLSNAIVVEGELLWPWGIREGRHRYMFEGSSEGWIHVKGIGGQEGLTCCWHELELLILMARVEGEVLRHSGGIEIDHDEYCSGDSRTRVE